MVDDTRPEVGRDHGFCRIKDGYASGKSRGVTSVAGHDSGHYLVKDQSRSTS